ELRDESVIERHRKGETGRLRGLLLGAGEGAPVLALEPFDSTGGVHELLLAGEERMAIRADFHRERTARRKGLVGHPACAGDCRGPVVRMNTFLRHDATTSRGGVYNPSWARKQGPFHLFSLLGRRGWRGKTGGKWGQSPFSHLTVISIS